MHTGQGGAGRSAVQRAALDALQPHDLLFTSNAAIHSSGFPLTNKEDMLQLAALNRLDHLAGHALRFIRTALECTGQVGGGGSGAAARLGLLHTHARPAQRQSA